MNPVANGDVAGRLLTFAVGHGVYAVPIADVSEVADLGHIAAIPTLPRSVGGVVNHHGDALPVLHREVLFEVGQVALPEARQLLVLGEHAHDLSRLGIPVDGILGLVDGEAGHALGDDPVAERRPVDGRIVNVLDARRLLARAVEVIERSVRGAEAS